MLTLVAAVCLVGWTSANAPAAAVKVDPPARVATVKIDNTKVAGRLSSYDENGFECLDEINAVQAVKWSELTAKSAMDVFATVLAKGTAEDWVKAGKVMIWLRGGDDFGERAFARALRMDPKLKDKIEEARNAPPEVGGTDDVAVAARREAVLNRLWGKLPDEEQVLAVKRLKEWAGKTRKGLDGSLKLLETKYFLFYSDLPDDEATKWSGLLDKMYARLAELFAVPRNTNVWRGKALVFVFSKAQDYKRFEAESHDTDSGTSAGMCHSYINGYVHIAFYRQPDEKVFAHVLVHESVHGFVHRYRSHVYLPSWANEGLAEVIATELVPHKTWDANRKSAAQGYVRTRGMGDDFFSVDHIAPWQYGVAETLTSHLIGTNKRGYVGFINGVKDGLSVDDSIKKNFGVEKDALATKYLESMGVKNAGK